MNERSAKFPARWLKALVEVSAKHTSRYAISGVLVNVKENKLSLASTDGRRLLEISGAEANSEDFTLILPAQAIKNLKIKKSDGDVIVSDLGHPKVGLKLGNVSVEEIAVEGNFPPYADVIPKPDLSLGSDSVVGFDAGLAGGILKAFDIAQPSDGDGPNGVRLSLYAPNKPIKFERSQNGAKMVGVLMPVSLPENVKKAA